LIEYSHSIDVFYSLNLARSGDLKVDLIMETIGGEDGISWRFRMASLHCRRYLTDVSTSMLHKSHLASPMPGNVTLAWELNKEGITKCDIDHVLVCIHSIKYCVQIVHGYDCFATLSRPDNCRNDQLDHFVCSVTSCYTNLVA